MGKQPFAILVCEDGWETTRKLALRLASQGTDVSIVIKGDPGSEVRRMISPKTGIRNYFVKRSLYRVAFFPLLLWLSLRKKHGTGICGVTKERTYRALKRFWLNRLLGCPGLYLFNDDGDRPRVIASSRDSAPIDDLFDRLSYREASHKLRRRQS